MVSFIKMHGLCYAVLRFRDILVRIRIRGYIPLHDLRIRILLFSSVAERCQQKIIFLTSFLLITFWRYIYTSVFEDKKSKRIHKMIKSRCFLPFLLVDGFYGMVCWFLWVVCSMEGRKARKEVINWLLGTSRQEIQWKRPRLFWSCLTLFHHHSLVILQKQAVPDIRREERLRERQGRWWNSRGVSIGAKLDDSKKRLGLLQFILCAQVYLPFTTPFSKQSPLHKLQKRNLKRNWSEKSEANQAKNNRKHG